jgi:FAD/FMN-containing dehydrogenase
MNTILAISPQDGVAVTQPGVITGDLQKAVRALGWDYPPDPASLKECSIGGNIATNAGGPRCLKYGVTRNYVIGLEVVLCNGRVMRCGGRTLKNKTGFDLIGLFVGSEGMLGIVTEITLRIIPTPPARGMLAAVFPDFAAAAQRLARAWRGGVGAVGGVPPSAGLLYVAPPSRGQRGMVLVNDKAAWYDAVVYSA